MRGPLIAAVIHCGLVIAAAIGILVSSEPDWPMVWIGFMVIDFPISLLYAAMNGLAPIVPSRIHLVASYSPLNDVWNFLSPTLFFGLVGSVWWFLLARWVHQWRIRRSASGGRNVPRD